MAQPSSPSRARTPAEFLASEFPWSPDVEWVGEVGIVRLDDDRRALLRPDCLNHADHYRAVQVEILHKVTGRIAAQTFKLGDIYPGEQLDMYRSVSSAGSSMWWQGARTPGDRGLLVGVVESFIAAFR